MTFFHLEGTDGNTKFAVNSHWWLYLAVAIPLTIAVGLAWFWMLKRKGYNQIRAPTIKVLDLEKGANPEPVLRSRPNHEPRPRDAWVQGLGDWKGVKR